MNLAGFAVIAAGWVAAFAFPADEPQDKSKDAAADKFTPEQVEFFEKEVQPILKARCLKCHGGEEKIRGELRLTSRTTILKGGDQGPAVSLESPAESLLIQAINYDGLEMPPTGRLPKSEVEILTRWVNEKLPWTPGKETPADTPKEHSFRVDDAARSYWAYRPLVRLAVPGVKNSAWVRNPIDAFVLAKLEAKGLAPAPPANKAALIRRAYYDLTGLPPSPEDIDAFVADKSADAFSRLIDKLLDSPQYGEKWGRHWLDLVRYAETHGYERDSAKPFAWRYRDYVIDAFNSDKPYDVFLREQLAGDEVDEVTPETMIATGYYRLGIWDDEPADRLLAKYDVLDGVVSTTSQVMLGMTVGCARCHDHKKDPIPQRDYYRLLALFRNVTDMNVKNTRLVATLADRSALSARLREKELREGSIFQELFRLEQQFAKALSNKNGGQPLIRTSSDLVDVTYRFYRDTWDRLPEFETLKPEDSGSLANGFITLAPASRQEAIGLVYEGKLQVPRAGDFRFIAEATEGMRLIVGGRTVIDRPEKGRHVAEGELRLEAGPVAIRLEYFNSTAKPSLKLLWRGPEFEPRPLTDESVANPQVLVADSRKAGEEWSYTFDAPADDWSRPVFPATGWQRGPGGFGTRGTPGALVRTEWNTKDIWLRKTFRAEEIPGRLSLQLHHDDEAEIYLNGTQIHKVAGYTVAYVPVLLSREATQALHPGDNVLSVHCHQTTGGQYIDVGLSAASDRDILVGLIEQQGTAAISREAVDRYFALAKQLEQSRNTPLPEPGIEVMCVDERGREPTHVLARGNPAARGELVAPGFPEVLCSKPIPVAERDAANGTSGRRLAFAKWQASPENPVTARVMANRLWQFHFGRGIVPTPNDFGKLGEPPTHPELLDWLASEFAAPADGSRPWTMKRLHRLIMLSSTYRMSSERSEPALEIDPGNSLFWRFNMRRLSAEEVRDSMLAVSGKLNLKSGGPSIYPPIPKAVLAGQSVPGSGWGNSPPEEANRRSVYVHIKRSLLVPILATHDLADTDSSCAVRFTTTVPTQSLGMLNGDFTNEQAAALAERLAHESPHNVAAQVRRAIRLTTGRQPAQSEVNRDVKLIGDLEADGKLDTAQALRLYCLLALNANEFVYLD